MKTANRASAKAGKNSPSIQSANALKNEPGETRPKYVSFEIVESFDGKPLGSLAIPPDIAEGLMLLAAEGGFRNVHGLILQELREAVRGRRRGEFPCAEFERVIVQTGALLHLLESKLQMDLVDKVNPRGPLYDPVEAMRAQGYWDMFFNAQKDLRAVFDSVFAWLQASDAAAAPAQ